LPEPPSADLRRSVERLAHQEDVAHIALMPDAHLAEHVCVGTVTMDNLFMGEGYKEIEFRTFLTADMRALMMQFPMLLFASSSSQPLAMIRLASKLPSTIWRRYLWTRRAFVARYFSRREHSTFRAACIWKIRAWYSAAPARVKMVRFYAPRAKIAGR
jgi:hypothetical protein